MYKFLPSLVRSLSRAHETNPSAHIQMESTKGSGGGVGGRNAHIVRNIVIVTFSSLNVTDALQADFQPRQDEKGCRGVASHREWRADRVPDKKRRGPARRM